MLSVDRAWTAGPMSVSPTGDAALTRGQGLRELLRRGDALRLRQRTPLGCLPEGSAEFLVLSGATVSELVTGFRRNGSVTGPRAAVDIFEVAEAVGVVDGLCGWAWRPRLGVVDAQPDSGT
jgi:hypothetical protein